MVHAGTDRWRQSFPVKWPPHVNCVKSAGYYLKAVVKLLICVTYLEIPPPDNCFFNRTVKKSITAILENISFLAKCLGGAIGRNDSDRILCRTVPRRK